jgi:uncharacterized protein involved in exopolysaccharide biosynthesis
MTNAPIGTGTPHSESSAEERLVYVYHSGIGGFQQSDLLNISDAWRELVRRRTLILAAATVGAIVSIAASVLAPKWYRAEVTLAPAERQPAQGLVAQFGGLASLAGVDIGGSDSAEPIAVLESRQFSSRFVEEFDLLHVFFADDWDSVRKAWKSDEQEDWPDTRDAVQYLEDNVRRVTQDSKTGLVTLAIQWKDPQAAAEWANALVSRLNEQMRQTALRDSSRNVEYLESELSRTNIVTLQQSIGRLLDAELQRLMLARGNEQFSFRVIDPAQVPRKPYRPRILLWSICGLLLSLCMAIVVVLFRHQMTRPTIVSNR